MQDVAVVYCRKSNESALPTDVSFDIQETECEKYAREKGYRVGKVLKESHTGADLIGRPLIWEAIDEVKSGRASVLLVRNFDRLARKPEHQGVILFEVEEKAGGRVESALEPCDPADTYQKTMRAIMGVVAEAERLNAVARMERGKQYRAGRGHLMGAPNPTFGYAWADDVAGERTRFAEDPETALIVRRIYRLALEGYGLRAIARTLNAEGVPTPSQWAAQRGYGGRRAVGGTWQLETVRRIIQERSYMGERVAYRTVQVRNKNGKKTGIVRPDGDGKRVRSEVPALVDEATWNAANAAIAAKETNGRPAADREATWLRLHVYCGVCKHRMHVKRDTSPSAKGQLLYKYECGTRANAGQCEGGRFSIRAHMLDPYAYELMTAWVGAYRLGGLRQKMIDRLGLSQVQTLVSVSEGYEAQLAAKQAELDTCRRRARQTTDDVLAGQFMADAEALLKDIAKLQTDYREARDQLDNFSAGAAWVDATLARIKAGLNMRGGLEIEAPTEADLRGLKYEERRLLLASLGLYLEVFPQGWRKDGKRVIGECRLTPGVIGRDFEREAMVDAEVERVMGKVTQSTEAPTPGSAATCPR